MKTTLRDKIAIAAMQAIIAKNPPLDIFPEDDIIQMEIAAGAYSYADAMLAERDK